MNSDNSDYLKDLLEKRKNLKNSMENNFKGLWGLLELCLAIRSILEIKGITLPFMGIVLAPPSSGKTTVVELMECLPNSYSLDFFTPRMFLSHYGGKTEEALKKIDLLPKIKNKIFLTPELAPLFSARDEDVKTNIGIITRVLDGKGLKTGSGIHGERSSGPVFFVWIGAAVDVSKNIWSLIANLGPKMFFIRLDQEESYEEEQHGIMKIMEKDDEAEKLEEVRKLLLTYWEAVTAFPFKENGKVIWDKSKEAPELMQIVVEHAQLLARLRGDVPVDKTAGTGGSNYGFLEPKIEVPKRATKYLYNLARGHALAQGRNYLIEEDLVILKLIILSSAQKERIELLKLLIKNNGEVSSTQVLEARRISKSTAQKTMKMLQILGLVDPVVISGKTKPSSGIRLKEHFMWILKYKE